MAEIRPMVAARAHPDADVTDNNNNNAVESERPAVRIAIARAKQEWECTVDALTQIVCVVDARGNIVRANRTIESWGLGGVREVQGRNLHSLLHPQCAGADCALGERLATAWFELAELGGTDFEVQDPLLGRMLQVTLRTMDPSGLAVIVLSDITTLHKIQTDLETMNEQLETRIEARTSELNASRDELSLLSAQLMTAQENDRKRIAQELHDSIGQSLSAIKYSLERAEEMIHNDGAAKVGDLLAMTIRRVQHTLDSIRSIAMNLRPSLLDDLGVVSAVRWFCREFNEVYPQIRVLTDIAVTDGAVPESLATTIFRTVQELLNNVARHARARNAFVSMRTDEARLVLEISDDGVGFEAEHPLNASLASGHGLSGLRERAATSGGTFSLQSRRGCGTVVRVGWPLRRAGFTLLELLVVMVIIGLLAGFVAPRYFAQVGKSQVKAASAQIDAFDKALDQYRIDLGRFPTTEEGLNGLMIAPPGEAGWGGPYLKKAVPADPWGHAYVYVAPGEHGEIDISSLGKDGRPGGKDENADITNW
jgi:general secretion pathway protein G